MSLDTPVTPNTRSTASTPQESNPSHFLLPQINAPRSGQSAHTALSGRLSSSSRRRRFSARTSPPPAPPPPAPPGPRWRTVAMFAVVVCLCLFRVCVGGWRRAGVWFLVVSDERMGSGAVERFDRVIMAAAAASVEAAWTGVCAAKSGRGKWGATAQWLGERTRARRSLLARTQSPALALASSHHPDAGRPRQLDRTAAATDDADGGARTCGVN